MNERLITPMRNIGNRLGATVGAENRRYIPGNDFLRWFDAAEIKIEEMGFKGKVIYLGRHENIKDAVKARNDYIIKNNLQDDYKIQNI